MGGRLHLGGRGMSLLNHTSDETRGVLNDLQAIAKRTGVADVEAHILDALTNYEQTLAAKRQAEAVVVAAQAEHDEAYALAYLVAGRDVTRDGNKTFVPDGDSTRQVTADEARVHVARKVAADPDVRAAATNLRAATVALEEVKDRITVAERRISATKYQTDAVVALTNLLALAFKETTR
jgi:hypothetical protein